MASNELVYPASTALLTKYMIVKSRKLIYYGKEKNSRLLIANFNICQLISPPFSIMGGCRGLTDAELTRVKKYFDEMPEEKMDRLTIRDKTLFFWGIYSGWRIRESLSLKLADVIEDGKIRDYVRVERKNTKGKIAAKNASVNGECFDLLTKYIEHYDLAHAQSDRQFWRTKNCNISVRRAQLIFRKIFKACGITGKNLGTHTTRKTFARKVYKATGENIYKTRTAMGHKSVDSTVAYIEADLDEIRDAVNSIKI